MYTLAMRHKHGRGLSRDLGEAMRLFEVAAKLGHLKSIEALGTGLLTGLFGTSDLRQALVWLRKGADGGSPVSQAQLGLELTKAPPHLGSAEEGMGWLRKSAQQGEAEGQAYLGHTLLERASPADKAEGIEWLNKATDQNNQEAQYFLGNAYLLGDGVSQDLDRAATLFATASMFGHRAARLALDTMFVQGQVKRRPYHEFVPTPMPPAPPRSKD
ncbi:tetratricopeptide repeat protein [Massilia glaciei]|uniref:Sel1 repeat family protein n=1 Tax=Massilia glaciei TaxID=1524097 RepID=A0A2U2HPE8_9BURK|nr:tetratricopeptide repeat protein [Massilia glaciei]PWF49381.1 sel1 repeat family protein [Massilia glaciei]